MKPVYQLYALISVGFISAFVILIAINPEPFLTFAAAVQEQLSNNAPILDLYASLEGMALVYAYLSGLYLFNLGINIVMTLLAYLSENKFYFRLTLYAFAINVVYFVATIYTARLLIETIAKPLKLFKKR